MENISNYTDIVDDMYSGIEISFNRNNINGNNDNSDEKELSDPIVMQETLANIISKKLKDGPIEIHNVKDLISEEMHIEFEPNKFGIPRTESDKKNLLALFEAPPLKKVCKIDNQYIMIEKKIVCPVSEGLKIIGGKWRLQIIFQIGSQKRRFGELKRLIPTISEKMLIQELKNLTAAGILNRKAYKEIPPRVDARRSC